MEQYPAQVRLQGLVLLFFVGSWVEGAVLVGLWEVPRNICPRPVIVPAVSTLAWEGHHRDIEG